jgi:geranylgeranyl pyrophosphate synthase
VQDDLPAMDDDAVRRRQAATHVRHGEGLALLASDALLAMAVEDVAGLATHPRVGPGRAAALLAQLARALGPHGLVGGQARDLLAREADDVTPAEVLAVHRRKTAPLFALAGSLAATLAGMDEPAAARVTALLADLGVAFQIVDDILDETPGNDEFGRPAGSDRRHRLPTFSALLGGPAARRYAERLLDPHLRDGALGPELGGLDRLARFVLDRRH